MFVGCHRDASSQVAYDEVDVFVASACLLGKTAGNGALVECVPNADARHEGRATDASLGQKFVDHAGVGNVSLAGHGLHGRQFVGNDAAQVAGVLAHGVVGVVAHAAVHAVDAAGNGLGQSAAPYDGVELEGDALGLKPVDDGLPAQVVLVHNLLEAPFVYFKIAVRKVKTCHIHSGINQCSQYSRLVSRWSQCTDNLCFSHFKFLPAI